MIPGSSKHEGTFKIRGWGLTEEKGPKRNQKQPLQEVTQGRQKNKAIEKGIERPPKGKGRGISDQQGRG